MNTNDNRLKAHKLIDHIFQDLLPAHGMAQRPEQIQLSHRMLEAMQDGRIALCDAGTGIGKTYAYLAAATAASAFPTGQIARPIIISTSSIALQNAVLAEYLLPKLENGEWKRILFVPTGALMSKVSFQEGSSVPGIAQAVVIEREEDV